LNARIRFHDGEVSVDLARAVSLAVPVDFGGSEPRHYGAPAPRSQPLAVPGFSGDVATGASCNCSTITLTPHCDGTHTESAGHLTREPLDAHTVVPTGLVPALLVSITPRDAASTDESTEPAPKKGDGLITRRALEQAWPSNGPLPARAIVIRTCGHDAAGFPYLTREAAALLVARGIEHLVVDLPSIDRAEDEGRLTAHRVFFGLPRGSQSLAQASRPQCTVTELARVPETLRDGWYLLELQAPALGGDAVPTRPLLYAMTT
jgi:kynurenine formamidase